MQERNDVTLYLAEANRGNSRAYDRVYELVYDDLKQIAHNRLFGFKRGDTLNTTALVHESYLKLINASESDWQDRAHFYAVASRAMRYILIDHIRKKSALMRGDGAEMKPLEGITFAVEQRIEDFITLNTALEKLLQWDERLGRLVEYRFIGGMAYEEISEVTGLSEATLKRDWVRARAWLYNVMKET